MDLYFATCPEETQEVLAAELAARGASDIKAGYKALYFSASQRDFYKMHLNLATASNLFQVLRTCASKNETMLLSQASRIPWPTLFSARKTYRVDGVAGDRGEGALSANAISKQVRLGIEHAFHRAGQELPPVDLKEPDIIVTAFIFEGRACISLQTSGKALHKRGYRLSGHPAPLKETVAASLLHLSGYDGSSALLDPFCGSGTIAIEAAYIALGKACNIHRKKNQFVLEHLKSFDAQLWREIQDELRRERQLQLTAPIFASDIEAQYVSLAQQNALRARVEKDLSFSCESFFNLKKPCEQGKIVTNLPYGERLQLAGGDLTEFYKQIGDHLKKEFSGWQAYLFVNDDSPWKFIGLKPKRKISLLNGSIKTKLLYFELYSGSHKAKKRGEQG